MYYATVSATDVPRSEEECTETVDSKKFWDAVEISVMSRCFSKGKIIFLYRNWYMIIVMIKRKIKFAYLHVLLHLFHGIYPMHRYIQ